MAGVNGADAGNGLTQTGTEQGYEHEIHTVQAAVDSIVTAANHGVVAAEDFVENPVVKMRIPSHRGARADTGIEGIVGILHPQVLDGFEANNRIEYLPL